MSHPIRRLGYCRWLTGVALVLLSQPLLAADNWELGKTSYTSRCVACHKIADGTGAGAQPFPAGGSASAIQTRINNGTMGNNDLKTTGADINDTVSDIAAYLIRTIFPLAQLAPVTTSAFDSISVGLTQALSFRLTNGGTDTLNVSSVSMSDTTNYSIPPNSCPTVNAGTSCDFVVTFGPTTADPFANTLTVNLNTFVTVRSTSMSGTGLTPFTVASPNPLVFMTSTTTTKTAVISDNKGDPIRICRQASAFSPALSAPADFTLDAPGAFDPVSGCYTIAAGAPKRPPIDVIVRFTPGAPGPRFADLRFERIGSGTATVTTLQLQGNPGGYLTLNASSLFDLPTDPGVEVDNDNTLTRSVTLFSQGSAPLPFTGSSFTISGPSSSEYTLAGTGCQTLAQLPAYVSGPAPSCVLTVIFNPSDVGRRDPANTTKLTIQIAGIADNVVMLNGFGFRGPRLAVRRGVTLLASGDIVQFGTQTIGGIYPNIPVTLANGGTLGNLDVILPAAGSVPGFTFTAPAGCAQLAPAAECTVLLHFDPAAIQAYASPFAIQTRPTGTSDAVKVVQLDLRGQGSASAMPVLSWTDGSGTPITQLAFADTNAGTPVTRNVRLYNAGPGGARLQLGNAIGLDSVNFALDTTDCGPNRDLYEITSCVVAVTFAPSTAGPKSVSAQYVAGAGTPLMLVVSSYLAITGTSIASAPPALLQPSVSSVQFTNTVVGSAGAPVEVRLTNTGSRSLNVTGFNVSAPFSVQTKSCPAVPFVLPAGGECSVNVIFQPTAEGSSSGTLQVNSDASTPMTAVALSGSAAPKADLSSGGCSIADGQSALDPTLWALGLLAAAVLWCRRRARGGAPRNGRTRR